MARSNLDIPAEVARLDSLALDQLREEWRRLYQTPPPKRLSRDILLRGITYKLQENAFGGLPKSLLRKLQSSDPGEAPPVPNVGADAGTGIMPLPSAVYFGQGV